MELFRQLAHGLKRWQVLVLSRDLSSWCYKVPSLYQNDPTKWLYTIFWFFFNSDLARRPCFQLNSIPFSHLQAVIYQVVIDTFYTPIWRTTAWKWNPSRNTLATQTCCLSHSRYFHGIWPSVQGTELNSINFLCSNFIWSEKILSVADSRSVSFAWKLNIC